MSSLLARFIVGLALGLLTIFILRLFLSRQATIIVVVVVLLLLGTIWRVAAWPERRN